ncbi:MAG: 7-cyano-7-deazaguanine synthase QueC [bacterium]
MKKRAGKKAVVLFSGGLDSATCLCWALDRGFDCAALGISYGQKHAKELICAGKIAGILGVKLLEINLELPWLKSSSLVDASRKLPQIALSRIGKAGLPSTYVPGRNLMFAAIAASLADSIGAGTVIAGPNALDYSGYPDCRPEFYRALQGAVKLGTAGSHVPRGKIRILTPLIHMSKAQIVRLAMRLKVPLEFTWSCYAGGKKPCGKCDSCKLRARGFKEAGFADPALG